MINNTFSTCKNRFSLFASFPKSLIKTNSLVKFVVFSNVAKHPYIFLINIVSQILFLSKLTTILIFTTEQTIRTFTNISLATFRTVISNFCLFRG